MIKVKAETVEKTEGQIEITLDCDENGLRELKSLIDVLLSRKNDHVHLFDQEWGGHDIEAEKSPTGLLITHIKIQLSGEN